MVCWIYGGVEVEVEVKLAVIWCLQKMQTLTWFMSGTTASQLHKNCIKTAPDKLLDKTLVNYIQDKDKA